MSGVPTFYLYGEPHQSVAYGFVHVETLDNRSRPSEWTIHPHSHAELNHIFLISTGGGSMQAEDQQIAFAAPCLLCVPATVVHGFVWKHESSGSVLTIATSYLADLTHRDDEIAALFRTSRAFGIAPADADVVRSRMDELVRELGWSSRGHRAAIDAAILSIFVVALRSIDIRANLTTGNRGHHAALVARLRERIEQRFRLREPVAVYAAALGVSMTTLRSSCAHVAGVPPAMMLDQRTLLEAKRSLLYSNLSIGEIGYAVGMSDPAYFSRFFARHVGESPLRYRLKRPSTQPILAEAQP